MKRFYQNATAQKTERGFQVLLDARPLKTPAGKVLEVEPGALAALVAQEWQEAGETLNPKTMLLTRLAGTALDLAATHKDQWIADLLRFLETDTVRFRSPVPELKRRQEITDPLIHMVEETFKISLPVTDGFSLPPLKSAAVRTWLEKQDGLYLIGLHTAAESMKSFILGYALAEGEISTTQAFEQSHLEELYSQETWGREEEQEQRLSLIRQDLQKLEYFFQSLES